MAWENKANKWKTENTKALIARDQAFSGPLWSMHLLVVKDSWETSIFIRLYKTDLELGPTLGLSLYEEQVEVTENHTH